MTDQRISGSVTLHHEAVQFWEEYIKPWVHARYHGSSSFIGDEGRVQSTDMPALRTSWNDYTDSLHKTYQISSWQFQNWTSPVGEGELHPDQQVGWEGQYE